MAVCSHNFAVINKYVKTVKEDGGWTNKEAGSKTSDWME